MYRIQRLYPLLHFLCLSRNVERINEDSDSHCTALVPSTMLWPSHRRANSGSERPGDYLSQSGFKKIFDLVHCSFSHRGHHPLFFVDHRLHTSHESGDKGI